MRVGVTGGNGFIGSYVVDELIRRHHEPVVFDHLGRSHRDDAEVLIGDVRDETAMLELAGHTDAIIHLAAILGTQETMHYPWPATETNVRGGLNFLHALKTYQLPGVYICVGNYWMRNPYSLSKTLVENYCRMFLDEHGTRVNRVRCVNAYGPRQLAATPYGSGKVRKITPAFVCRALTGADIEVYGDGEQVSDMVYVGDVASVLVQSMEAARMGITPTEAIEAGPEKSCTVNQVAEQVIHACQARGYDPVAIKHLPMRPGEIAGDRVSADWTTLERVSMSVENFLPLSEGIARTVRWFDENRGITWHED